MWKDIVERHLQVLKEHAAPSEAQAQAPKQPAARKGQVLRA